jgi:branched-subunit amino acid aminotransferase/4-amino-4-deoxychorismate lyase
MTVGNGERGTGNGTVGLIETIRVRNGAAPLWTLHLQRLETSCRALGLPVPSLTRPSGGPDRVHRILVTRTGVELTEREAGDAKPVRLRTTQVIHQAYPHKTTARALFERAAAEAESARADEGLLLTGDDWVAETSIYGVFWWEGDRLCAPSLALGVLPGVARARLAEVAGGLEERRIRPSTLLDAGLFLANAVRGVVAVTSWDGRAIASHPNTARLGEGFWV